MPEQTAPPIWWYNLSMNSLFPQEVQAFIDAQVKSGRYASPTEVVVDALLLLRDQERFREMKLQDLRKEVEVGIDQAERGLGRPFTKATVARIKANGRKRLSTAAQRRKAS